MAIKYIKKAAKTPETDDHKTQAAVQDILNDIAKRKEVALKELNKKFDKYDGEVIVSKEKIEEAIKKVDQKTKDDVKFAHERIKKFAEHQLKSMNNGFEVELSKGLFAGQRLIPVDTAGCYIPGGRYAHISSAVMAITPAKVAGVKTIICASPPKDKDDIGSFITGKNKSGISLSDITDMSNTQSAGIPVNALLWRASLDITSMLPIDDIDVFSGTLITDWYSLPAQPSEQIKLY